MNTQAQNRLTVYRTRAAKISERHPAHTPTTWRDCRYEKNRAPRYGWTPDGDMWAEGFDNVPGHRETLKASEVLRLRHDGWFTDIHGDGGTLYGVVNVLRLGQWAYIVHGTAHTEWDAYYLEFSRALRIPAREAWDECGHKTSELDDLINTAARWADNLAERDAETAHEDDEKYRAAEYCEQLREDIKQSRDTVRELIRDIRAAALPFGAGICTVLRNKIREELQLVHQWRRGIEELTARPYMIHDYK